MNEVEFLKETVKKLIYAIEQNQVSSVKTPQIQPTLAKYSTVEMNGNGGAEPTNLPNLMKPSKSTRNGSRTATTKHGSKSFFRGSQEHIDLPDKFSVTLGSVQGAESATGGSQPILPSTSEILFLKRLLYLKASIDNESTLNAFSVPFEQEKRRESANPDEMRLNVSSVVSKQEYAELSSTQQQIQDQYHQALAQPPKTAAIMNPRNKTQMQTYGKGDNMGLQQYLEHRGTDYKKI